MTLAGLCFIQSAHANDAQTGKTHTFIEGNNRPCRVELKELTAVAKDPTLTVNTDLCGRLEDLSVHYLFLTEGCVNRICVGDTVFIGKSNAVDVVHSINPFTKFVILESSTSEALDILDTTTLGTCLGAVCIGHTVHHSTMGSVVIKGFGTITNGRLDSIVVLDQSNHYKRVNVTELNINGVAISDRVSFLLPRLVNNRYDIPEVQYSFKRPTAK